MSRSIFGIFLIGSLAASFVYCQTGRGEKYAFLIVCSKYNNTRLKDLPYTIEEMEDFKKALLKTGFEADHIVMLHDKADRERVPQKAQIEKQFRLTELQANTTYHYAAETTGRNGKPAHAALRGSFQTAPAPDRYEDVTFTVISCSAFRSLDHDDGFHIYPAMAACAQGRKVRFFRVTELITLLLEAKEERQLLRLRQLRRRLKQAEARGQIRGSLWPLTSRRRLQNDAPQVHHGDARFGQGANGERLPSR